MKEKAVFENFISTLDQPMQTEDGGSITLPSEHLWQIRVALDTSDLEKYQQDRDKIKTIVQEVFEGWPVSAKLYNYTSDQSYQEDYDIACSGLKDRTERGKELCIYFPNKDGMETCSLKADDVKEKLLLLWARLSKAGIRMNFLEPQGDRSIPGPNEWPTPFSFACNANRPTGSEEWTEHNGILFHEFESHDEDYPFLSIKITTKDLNDHGIRYNSKSVIGQTGQNIASHYCQRKSEVKAAIAAIDREMPSIAERLNDSALLDGINAIIDKYKEMFDTLSASGDSGMENATQGAMSNFAKEIAKFQPLQELIAHYPHQADSFLKMVPEIVALNDPKFWQGLTLGDEAKTQINSLLEKLKEKEEELRSSVGNDFIDLGSSTVLQLAVNYCDYFDKPNDITGAYGEIFLLAEKSPYEMQKIFRRIVLLEQEKNYWKNICTHSSEPVNTASGWFSGLFAKQDATGWRSATSSAATETDDASNLKSEESFLNEPIVWQVNQELGLLCDYIVQNREVLEKKAGFFTPKNTNQLLEDIGMKHSLLVEQLKGLTLHEKFHVVKNLIDKVKENMTKETQLYYDGLIQNINSSLDQFNILSHDDILLASSIHDFIKRNRQGVEITHGYEAKAKSTKRMDASYSAEALQQGLVRDVVEVFYCELVKHTLNSETVRNSESALVDMLKHKSICSIVKGDEQLFEHLLTSDVAKRVMKEKPEVSCHFRDDHALWSKIIGEGSYSATSSPSE